MSISATLVLHPEADLALARCDGSFELVLAQRYSQGLADGGQVPREAAGAAASGPSAALEAVSDLKISKSESSPTYRILKIT